MQQLDVGVPSLLEHTLNQIANPDGFKTTAAYYPMPLSLKLPVEVVGFVDALAKRLGYSRNKAAATMLHIAMAEIQSRLHDESDTALQDLYNARMRELVPEYAVPGREERE